MRISYIYGTREITSMYNYVVWRLLKRARVGQVYQGSRTIWGECEEEAEKIYERGRSGNQLLTHFQCNLCNFMNIQGRGIYKKGEGDTRLMFDIMRDNLYEFWRRELGTVRANLNMVKMLRNVDRELLGIEEGNL